MTCAKNLGLIDIPIVCININEYYHPIQEMFHLCGKQRMLKRNPDQILDFKATAVEALIYLEGRLLSEDGRKQRMMNKHF